MVILLQCRVAQFKWPTSAFGYRHICILGLLYLAPEWLYLALYSVSPIVYQRSKARRLQIANKKIHGFLYISKLIIHKFLHKNS